LYVVSSLRRVVAVGLWRSLLRSARFFGAAFLDPSRVRRRTTKLFTRRHGWSAVLDVVKTSTVLLIGLLLDSRLFLPLTATLGAN
jgi:hypothetical protein